MRRFIPALFVVLLCGRALAAPLHTYDFDDAKSAEGWNRKSNTVISVRPPSPFKGDGAMRFTIDPAEFSFGWIHRPLPAMDFGQLVGVGGVFRAVPGAVGHLRMYFCLHSEGRELSYFAADLGKLSDSNGQWVEFYAALRDLRYERGPLRSLRPGALGTNDLIQFMAGVEGRRPVAVDVDQVEFLNAADAAAVAVRCAQAARGRLLMPENEIAASSHPRLFFTPERLPLYRAKAKTGDERQAAYERLLALASEMLTRYNAADPFAGLYKYVEESKFEGVPWRAAFEGEIVSASHPIEILGAAYRLTGDRRFGAHGARALVAAAGRLTTDESFLARGFYYSRTFYVRALGFGYDWLWDVLSPDERRLVKTTLLGFVQDIHERSQTDSWGRRPLHRVWNWAPGLMGACGIGMLAMEGETRLAEKAILFDCRRHLRDYLVLGIDADGCCHEGPNYIGYGIGAGVEFVEALRLQGRGDLFVETNYHLIPPWLIAETLPDGRRWNNLSDCGHGQAAWPVYMYACGRLAELARGGAAVSGEARWPAANVRSPLDFLQQFAEAPGPRRLGYASLAGLMGWAWQRGPGRIAPADYSARESLAHVLLYEPCAPAPDPALLLPLGIHFRGRGLVVSRTGFGPDDVYLAVEAGPHAAGHDQSDKGTFTLYAYGGDLAIDSGYGNDGDPLKSGSSHAHNVVLIDGEGQPMRYHNQSSGRITGFQHSPLLDWIRVDAAEAWNVRYDSDLTPMAMPRVAKAERSFLFVRPRDGAPPYLVVYDDIVKDAREHDYTWLWHIPAQMKFGLADGVWTASPRPRSHDVLTSPPTGPAGSAVFKFNIPTAGRYVVYGLARAGGPEQGKSDSFFVSMDGGDRLCWDLQSGAHLSWGAVTHRGEPTPRIFELAEGPHVLRLEVRERQAELARWLVMPAEAASPLDPDGTPDGAVALSLADAVIEKPGLERRREGEVVGPDAFMDVFPVNPPRGEAKTDWFLTSREGAHPRLLYSARAVEPHFLKVFVPRRSGVSRPSVTPLAGEGGVGVAVKWPSVTDHIVFARDKASCGKMRLEASAGLVRLKNDAVAGWALLDGVVLEYDGIELHRSPQRTVVVGEGR